MPHRILTLIDIRQAYGRNILRGLIDQVHHREHGQILHEFRWTRAIETRLEAGSIHGIVTELGLPDELTHLARYPIPAVIVTGAKAQRPYPMVIADNAAVGTMAFDHLHSLGLRHVACYGWTGKYFSDMRERHFRHAAEARGLTVTSLNALPGHHDDPTDALAAQLRQLPRPVGVFAVSDLAARDVALACECVRLRVPEDVAILGVDNDELICEANIPPLSSIDNGTLQIGRRAGELILRLIEGHPPPSCPLVVEPVGVVVRQSTDVIAVDHPGLASALRYIRRHACRGIGVADVLDTVPVSRRALEMQCKKTLGRTLQQEITRVQVDHARHLLMTTVLPTPDIASRCGFSSASQLSVVFKREVGCTPTAHRQRFS